MRIFIFLLLSIACVSSYSQVQSSIHEARIGSKVISEGDSASRVLDAGGQPARKTDLINKFGVKLGEEWEYIVGKSTIYIRFNNGGIVYEIDSVINNR